MKKLNSLLMLLAIAGVFYSCSEDNLLGFEKEMEPGRDKEVTEDVMVTMPFKTDLTVWNYSDYSDESCGGFPNFKLTMLGEGTSTHLGKLSISFIFCCNVQTDEYRDTEVVYTAANGDELYAYITKGDIVTNMEENANRYGTRFNDKMEFTGGTGRFEGASGMAMTNAFVHDPSEDEYVKKGDEVWHADFFSYGEITLKKGER